MIKRDFFFSLLSIMSLIEVIISFRRGHILIYEQEDFQGYSNELFIPIGQTRKVFSSVSGFNSSVLSVELGGFTAAKFTDSAGNVDFVVNKNRNINKTLVGDIVEIVIQTYDQYLSDPNCVILFDGDYFEEDDYDHLEICLDPDDPGKIIDLSNYEDESTTSTWDNKVRSILNPWGLIIRHIYDYGSPSPYYVDFDGSFGNYLVKDGEMTDIIVHPWDILDFSSNYASALQFLPRNATSIPPDCVRLYSHPIIGYGESVDICKDTDLTSVGRFNNSAYLQWKDYAKSIEVGENVMNYTFFKTASNVEDLFTNPSYVQYTNSCFAELTNEFYDDGTTDSVADKHRFLAVRHWDSETTTPVIDDKLSPMGKNCFYLESIGICDDREGEYMVIHFNSFEEALDFRFNRNWEERESTGLIRCLDGKERYFGVRHLSWAGSNFCKYPICEFSPYVSQHLKYERKVYDENDYNGNPPKLDVHYLHIKYFETYELESKDTNGMWNSRTRRAKEYQNNLFYDSKLSYCHYEPYRNFTEMYPTELKTRTYTRVRNYETNGDWTVFLP